MATYPLSPHEKVSIQERTIVYSPIYANGMKDTDLSGSYVLFYIFSESKSLSTFAPSGCIVESLDKFARTKAHTFVKIGNFSSGSKSRNASNKGDLIKLDGNRSPAARHSQDVLLMYPDLYLHFIMVVLTKHTVEADLLKALDGIVTSVDNKQEKISAAPGKWNAPETLTTFSKLSPKLTTRIRGMSK